MATVTVNPEAALSAAFTTTEGLRAANTQTSII